VREREDRGEREGNEPETEERDDHSVTVEAVTEERLYDTGIT